ncbi:MAG: ribosomal protein S18-alanine N-acetyltransferase [Pseudomonadota bacterium]
MWRIIAPVDAVPLGLLEEKVQLTPWSIQNVRETLEHGGIGWAIENEADGLYAYIIIQPAVDTADILTLGVHPNYQRQGLGRAALQCAKNWLVEHKLETLFLEVRVSNETAVALYQACGFKIIHRRKNYYNVPTGGGMREDAWIMSWQN